MKNKNYYKEFLSDNDLKVGDKINVKTQGITLEFTVEDEKISPDLLDGDQKATLSLLVTFSIMQDSESFEWWK